MSSVSVALRRTLLTTAPRFITPTTLSGATRTRVVTKSALRYTTSPRHFSHTATMGKGVHNLASKEHWDNALKEDSNLVVLDCFATWCGPCKVIAPKVVQFSEAYPNARFYKIDVDEVPDVAQELGIRAMPTFLFYKDGQKVEEVVGANPVAIEAAIKKHSA